MATPKKTMNLPVVVKVTPKAPAKPLNKIPLTPTTKGNIIGKSATSRTKTFIPAAKSPSVPLKSYKPGGLGGTKTGELSSFTAPTSTKSSTSFGVIWIPTKKNKNKDFVYKPHGDYNYSDKSPLKYDFMHGEPSSSIEYLSKKDEIKDNFRDKTMPSMSVASASTAVAVADASTETELFDDAEDQPSHSKQEIKDAGGDVNDKKDSDYLEDKDEDNELENNKKQCKLDEKQVDNVDSVFLKRPPACQTHSQVSHEEQDCTMSCVYCMMMCCECSIM